MSEITRQELAEKVALGGKFVLIDVLPPSYFRHSHLPGAINLPYDEIALRIEEFAFHKKSLVVVYCLNSECAAAQKAVQILVDLGYENVCEYSEGKDGWRRAGLALEGESRSLKLQAKSHFNAAKS